ncbi:MAG: FAD-dependent monooxygenase [Pararhodobacter sp.]|nr:FAD-dependent monooxygenase [Pararhodobacter sp.]
MTKLSSVAIIGAGPAGLYAAILIRRLMPHVKIDVMEQNPEGATFGFGVVFSDRALEFLKADDPETHDLITSQMERWRNMTLNLPGGSVTLDGVGFTAIGRLQLIKILTERARELDIPVHFNTQISDVNDLTADLVIGADGLNSLVRRTFEADFKPQVESFGNHFAWFGATVPFDTLTQTFIATPFGPMNAHHYRFAPDRSTFIVECDDETFHKGGFDGLDETESAKRCSALFADVLAGTSLVTNKSMWRQFPRLWCENWVTGRFALLGDAVHTAHFSIGSGTRLALEDAIALAQALNEHDDLTEALTAYQEKRPPIARKIVDAANTSANWYESFGEKMGMAPMDFAHDYLMRSGRMTEERLRQIAPKFAADFAAHRALANRQ